MNTQHPLVQRYPDHGDPLLLAFEIRAIEKMRGWNRLDERDETFVPIPHEIKKFAGLSRQCQQRMLGDHMNCMDGTRASCTCSCHTENRPIGWE